MPEDLQSNAEIWRRRYAEQLRCWELWIEAAEMEKSNSRVDGGHGAVDDGVFPVQPAGQRKATCSVCGTIITKIEQMCPACLHTAHLSCLEAYLDALDSEKYQCPSGCGCHCAELPFEVINENAEPSQPPKHLAKKPSFTDPRRWRARIEADSP
jgi:hypothetical protein